MITSEDANTSTLAMLVQQALKQWETNALHTLLSESEDVVRFGSAREIQKRGEKISFSYIVKLSSSENSREREICAFTLGQLGTPTYPYKEQSYPILKNLLRDESSAVRAAAAAGIGHMSRDGMPMEVENALVITADDESSEVRSCVAFALGNSSGRQEIVDTLNQLCYDNDDEVRSYAELGLDLLR